MKRDYRFLSPAVPQRRRGISLVVTLGLMLLLGATLTAMAALITNQVRRTQAATVSAQQRQLLFAGTQAILTALKKDNDFSATTLALPPELTACTITCDGPEWLDPAHTVLKVRVHVTVQSKSLSAQLRLARTDRSWTLLESIQQHS